MSVTSSFEIHAPAKINLGLRVLEKRPDGFHNIETVFLPIEWCDTIRFGPDATIRFTCTDAELEDEQNLCLRAARLLSESHSMTRGAHIHLEKVLPVGAGLGGGSSDAAAVLLGLCRLWEIECPPGMLADLALQLGSDVSFFLDPEPSLGQGRGEILTPIDPAGRGEKKIFPEWAAVAVPKARMSTADAYAEVVPEPEHDESLDALLASTPPGEWKDVILNDFESSVFRRLPELEQLKRTFYRHGAVYASLSGSGSCVYALFNRREHAERALHACGLPGWSGAVLL